VTREHRSSGAPAPVPVTKLAIVVRTDLDMGRGKIAAQAAHAAVGAVLAPRSTRHLSAWVADGQPKVVLRVDDGGALDDVVHAALAAGVPVHAVCDAGRTQVEPGSVTCCAVGPAPGPDVDAATGALRLL
jgi:PTH2 family peptidyl-tRNA hydrolase